MPHICPNCLNIFAAGCLCIKNHLRFLPCVLKRLALWAAWATIDRLDP